MSYSFFVLPKHFIKMRENIFKRMQEEKLLTSCMHSIKNPTLQHWIDITCSPKGWLLCCVPADAKTHDVSQLCGIAWLEPWQGQAWLFDFTAFRKYFAHATTMSKAALNWTFKHAKCQSIVGICPVSNAHAWRLAPKAGFNIITQVPGACFNARLNIYEDGVLVMATKSSISDF